MMGSCLIVCGATGRTGSKIFSLAREDSFFSEVIPVSRKDPLVGVVAKGDLVIDFTLPEATDRHVLLALQYKKPLVIGTTGLTAEQKTAIREAAKTIPILISPNMAVGVNVLFELLETAARALSAGFQVEVSETHHRNKKDKPSGTAKRIGDIVEKHFLKMPPIASKREGDVAGEHEVTFDSPLESLCLKHIAKDRSVFAHGALQGAKWLLKKKPGLYTMKDVLGLKQ